MLSRIAALVLRISAAPRWLWLLYDRRQFCSHVERHDPRHVSGVSTEERVARSDAEEGAAERWHPLLEELEARREASLAMGGDERLARQRRGGRLDARARIAQLCDPGSFRELASLAGLGEAPPAPADGYPCGLARIDGRPVAIGAEDFSVQGGSIGISGATKRERLARVALQERIPFVAILEGAGARASKALERHTPGPIDLQTLAELSGRVPTLALVAGASAGHGALTAALADFVVMVRGVGALFTAGPPLVRAAIGERVDKEALGGADLHCGESGVAQLAVDSEAEGFDALRRYLSYFPSNGWGRTPWAGPGQGNTDVSPRPVDALLALIPPDPRVPYDVVPVLESTFDMGSVFVVQPAYGRCIVTALARLGGHAVALVANQPASGGGAIDAEAAEKAARFIEIAGSFHLPVVFLSDNPGVLAGSRSERAGILRAGARMFAAQHRLRGPKVHVTLRKSFGFGAPIMGMNLFDGRTWHFALPGVTLATMPARSAGAASKSNDETVGALASAESSGPWKLASEASYDDVIDPRQLRDVLIDVLSVALREEHGPLAPLERIGHLP
jgi:acetyl-CoA carboxylase carboxyltransferase component